jgi:Protein of unknown function (DUF1353)
MEYRRIKKQWKYELLGNMEISVDIPVRAKNRHVTLDNNKLRVHAYYRMEVWINYHWDGPSGPTFDTKTFMRASLFHDALCQLIGEGLLDKKYRKYADQLLRQIALEDGMSKFRAWYVYMAVRAYSKLKGM